MILSLITTSHEVYGRVLPLVIDFSLDEDIFEYS